MVLSTSSDHTDSQKSRSSLSLNLFWCYRALYSIPPASWLPFSSSTVDKPQHYQFVLFSMCLLLLSTKLCPNSRSALPRISAPVSACDCSVWIIQWPELLWSQPKIPSNGRAPDFTNRRMLSDSSSNNQTLIA